MFQSILHKQFSKSIQLQNRYRHNFIILNKHRNIPKNRVKNKNKHAKIDHHETDNEKGHTSSCLLHHTKDLNSFHESSHENIHDYFIIPPKFKNTDLLYEGCVYTDASIINKVAGIGIWSNHYELNNSWALKNNSLIDINRAELGAILIALIKLDYNGDVHILSDSLTSLKLINGSIELEKFSLITRCVQYMRDNWKGIIKFKKVKGHSGNIGNENADKLAHVGVVNHCQTKPLYLPDDIFTKDKGQDIKQILDITKNINEL